MNLEKLDELQFGIKGLKSKIPSLSSLFPSPSVYLSLLFRSLVSPLPSRSPVHSLLHSICPSHSLLHLHTWTLWNILHKESFYTSQQPHLTYKNNSYLIDTKVVQPFFIFASRLLASSPWLPALHLSSCCPSATASSSCQPLQHAISPCSSPWRSQCWKEGGARWSFIVRLTKNFSLFLGKIYEYCWSIAIIQ